jgi:hypothetical protein
LSQRAKSASVAQVLLTPRSACVGKERIIPGPGPRQPTHPHTIHKPEAPPITPQIYHSTGFAVLGYGRSRFPAASHARRCGGANRLSAAVPPRPRRQERFATDSVHVLSDALSRWVSTTITEQQRETRNKCRRKCATCCALPC